MESSRLLNSLNMANFYVRLRSWFLLLAHFSSFFPHFLIYFYCFLMISICFPTDFLKIIQKDPRNSMTLAKRSNVQTKPNQTKPNQTKPNQTKPNQTKPNQTKPNEHIITEDFRISELVTLVPGFAWAALRAVARGLWSMINTSTHRFTSLIY